MKLNSKAAQRFGAIAAAVSLTVGALAGCASSSSPSNKTFTIWWYDVKTAQSATWAPALAEFKKENPGVTVKFELKTWDQIQNAGNSILSSNAAPDISEWNKGNATAGSASQAGLLTNLDSYAKQYGWNTKLPSSALQVGEYTNGIMGKGSLYGVSTYGEYVGWFYNKDLFAKYNIPIPTTQTELDAAMAAFKAAGQTPQVMAGGDYQIVHMVYALALSQANTQWVNNYQFFTGPTDFHGPELSYAANTVAKWVKAGYFEPNVAGVKATEAVNDFIAGKYPLMLGGTWLDTQIAAGAKFQWGKFMNPGTKSEGSAGNIWVIPTKSKNKDLAAKWINLLLQPKYQTLEGNNGGLPIMPDPATITDPTGKLTSAVFNKILSQNGIGFYPDWPSAGYYNELLKDGTQLVSGALTPNAYLTAIGAFYNANKPAGK